MNLDSLLEDIGSPVPEERSCEKVIKGLPGELERKRHGRPLDTHLNISYGPVAPELLGLLSISFNLNPGPSGISDREHFGGYNPLTPRHF